MNFDNKAWNTILLVILSLIYVTILAIVTNKMGAVAFIFGLIPLIIVIAGMLGYGIKAKFPTGEFEYYPVEKLMQPAHKISGEKTILEAENLMEKAGIDFLNVINGGEKFIGIFTRADAHKARRQRKMKEEIKKFMTPREKVIKAKKGERLIDIMERMGKTKHSRLPVLDGEKVIGVIDSVDIHDFLSKLSRGI